MKKLVVLGIMVFLTISAFSQKNVKVVEYYKRHEQINPFFMRWYWRLNRLPTTVWIETLRLTDDKNFVHYTSTSSLPGWRYGTWKKKDNILTLRADSSNGNILESYPLTYQFIILNKRLYQLDKLEKEDWVMKKSHR
ncbi:hypothetical protein [Persicitalea jodogahamensis]|uniref:Uncharacterized protein n=1 Tax=Persicitalea jodogahamensis TaxID=402147 RepID=A0A8J3G7N1_9BACT|nr:hypothetical protein [Persicitalea jodogahamensis]GHB57909.1 hypothetical protein GCM10007390_09190 [Persicitalea jodogahamensis]